MHMLLWKKEEEDLDDLSDMTIRMYVLRLLQ